MTKLKEYFNSNHESLYSICAGIIHADNVVESGEIKYCFRLMQEMFGTEIDFQRFNEIVSSFSSSDEINKHLMELKVTYDENSYSNDDFEFLIIALIILGLSDLHLDEKEIEYLNLVGSYLNISGSKILELINKTESLAEKLIPDK